jgi:filamentous hemagglutinin
MAGADALPGAERAVVAREKLEDYLLNPRHELGRHKARVFAAALGIHRPDWEYLRDRIEAGVVDASVTSIRETPWGRLYEVVVPIEGLNGQTRRVMTVWLVPPAHEPPRFVTGYVVDPARDA